MSKFQGDYLVKRVLPEWIDSWLRGVAFSDVWGDSNPPAARDLNPRLFWFEHFRVRALISRSLPFATSSWTPRFL